MSINKKIYDFLQKELKKRGYDIIKSNPILDEFRSIWYIRHNQRRLEHFHFYLSTILSKYNKSPSDLSVIEVGAGVGDFTQYFVDGHFKSIDVSDARSSNVEFIKSRFKGNRSIFSFKWNVEEEIPNEIASKKYDLIFCYGTLYHTNTPIEVLNKLSLLCSEEGVLFLETCVHPFKENGINLVSEDNTNPTQAVSTQGCRPGRLLLLNELKKRFSFIYIPTFQPNHPEFDRLKDNTIEIEHDLVRCVYIASNQELNIGNQWLQTDLGN